VRQLYARLSGKPDFTWLDVLALIECEPDLAKINDTVAPKSLYEYDRRNNR